MASSSIVSISARLILGAAAAFLAILVWAKTREAPWILIVAGVIAGYITQVYSTLAVFGITTDVWFSEGTAAFVSGAIECLPAAFFIIGFAIMIRRKYRN